MKAYSLESESHEMNMEGLLDIESGVLRRCAVDFLQIDEHARLISIPEGVERIESGAFNEYNFADNSKGVSYILHHRDYYVNENRKQVNRRQPVKIYYPENLKTITEKAEYMLDRDLDVRLLELSLPASLKSIGDGSFPVYLKAIHIPDENPFFKSVDGVLFSKDGETLIRFPGYNSFRDYEIPDTVTALAPQAFDNAAVNKLTIPASIKKIPSDCFKNSVMKELVISEGVAEIEAQAFEGSRIEEIRLPSTLRIIGDYAFRESIGVKTITCESDDLKIGNGLFSEGKFEDVSWWCWKEIPKAAFLNADIKNIEIPQGVENISEYAFAGCYKARKVSVPESVKEIGPHAFDLGLTWNRQVSLPKSLYHYLYRFPACITIGKRYKSEIWDKRENRSFREDPELLLGQRRAIEEYLPRLQMMQFTEKKELKRQLKQIDDML